MNQRLPKEKNNSEKFKHGFKTWAETKSLSIRNEMGLNPHDFLCAFKLCAHLNIPVLTPQDIDGLSEAE